MTSGGRGLKNDDVSIFFKIKAVNKTGGQGLTQVEATFLSALSNKQNYFLL